MPALFWLAMLEPANASQAMSQIDRNSMVSMRQLQWMPAGCPSGILDQRFSRGRFHTCFSTQQGRKLRDNVASRLGDLYPAKGELFLYGSAAPSPRENQDFTLLDQTLTFMILVS
jgi:hypothetical protein